MHGTAIAYKNKVHFILKVIMHVSQTY